MPVIEILAAGYAASKVGATAGAVGGPGGMIIGGIIGAATGILGTYCYSKYTKESAGDESSTDKNKAAADAAHADVERACAEAKQAFDEAIASQQEQHQAFSEGARAINEQALTIIQELIATIEKLVASRALLLQQIQEREERIRLLQANRSPSLEGEIVRLRSQRDQALDQLEVEQQEIERLRARAAGEGFVFASPSALFTIQESHPSFVTEEAASQHALP